MPLAKLCRPLVVAAVLALGATVAAGPALANEALDDHPAIHNKVKILDGRHMLTPGFGFTVNDDYVQNFIGSLGWRYYLQSWLGIGVNIGVGAGVDTGLTDQINTELNAGGRTAPPISTSAIRLAADFTAELVPFQGKFMIFGNTMLRTDFHILAGFGVAMTAGSGRLEDEVSLMPTFGAGVRIFPSEWISVGIDIRNLVIKRALSDRRDGSVPEASFGMNWLVGFSVGFFLPTEPEIRP